MKLALATCLTPSRPDVDLLPLQAALQASGLDVEVQSWDDPAVDWSRFDAVIIRSTWNYIHDLDAYRRWIDVVAARCRLYNPAEVVHWNLHKSYLVELAAAGLPVVPTTLHARGTQVDLGSALERWSHVVVKPAVSAGSFATIQVTAAERVRGQAHLDARLGERDMLVQPFVPQVGRSGEHALLFFAGLLSHAVRKGARFAGDGESITPLAEVPQDEQQAAAAILAAVRPRFAAAGTPAPLYARVDLARGEDGRPLLMELELIEPALFLARHPRAMANYVAAVHAVVAAG